MLRADCATYPAALIEADCCSLIAGTFLIEG